MVPVPPELTVHLHHLFYLHHLCYPYHLCYLHHLCYPYHLCYLHHLCYQYHLCYLFSHLLMSLHARQTLTLLCISFIICCAVAHSIFIFMLITITHISFTLTHACLSYPVRSWDFAHEPNKAISSLSHEVTDQSDASITCIYIAPFLPHVQ